MEELTVSIQLTAEDVTAFQRHHLKSNRRVRRQRQVIVGVMLMLGVAFVAAGIVVSRLLEEVSPALLVGFFFLGFAAWLAFSWRRVAHVHVKRMMGQGLGRSLFAPMTLTLSPDGIRIRGELFEEFLRWQGVHSVASTSEHAFVFITPDHAYIVPRRAFASDPEFSSFTSAAAAYVAAAPIYELQCPDCKYDLRNLSVTACPECGWRRADAVKRT